MGITCQREGFHRGNNSMTVKFSFPCPICFSSASDIMATSKNNTGGQTTQNFPVFSYKELKAATNGFHSSNKIGEGGFGTVYKGRLGDGTFVAVKVLLFELESLR
ncbi:unnamed protein product [Ilex paraguariensis]|uniref:Protein kinase domain-containing protein n=1 Tax=Ilex paraguariensis TaxID=185542 RepID=A0ABC8U8U5_9AQUA